jgi:hypothetical protein
MIPRPTKTLTLNFKSILQESYLAWQVGKESFSLGRVRGNGYKWRTPQSNAKGTEVGLDAACGDWEWWLDFNFGGQQMAKWNAEVGLWCC